MWSWFVNRVVCDLWCMKQEDWVLCRVFYKSREEGSASASKLASSDVMGLGVNSNSLPALMDAYISFDQPRPTPTPMHPHNHETLINSSPDHHHQQVPCFSRNINLPQNYQSAHDLILSNLPAKTATTSTCAEATLGVPTFVDNAASLDPFSFSRGDNELVLKAILNQLTNPDFKGSGSPVTLSIGDGTSESYNLSETEVGMANVWAHYWYIKDEYKNFSIICLLVLCNKFMGLMLICRST